MLLQWWEMNWLSVSLSTLRCSLNNTLKKNKRKESYSKAMDYISTWDKEKLQFVIKQLHLTYLCGTYGKRISFAKMNKDVTEPHCRVIL